MWWEPHSSAKPIKSSRPALGKQLLRWMLSKSGRGLKQWRHFSSLPGSTDPLRLQPKEMLTSKAFAWRKSCAEAAALVDSIQWIAIAVAVAASSDWACWAVAAMRTPDEAADMRSGFGKTRSRLMVPC